MHEFVFAEAALPIPAVCLRLPLQTYSVGHEILLLRQHNPLLCLPESDFNELPENSQITALRRAVLVCSSNWQQNTAGNYFTSIPLLEKPLSRLWVRWCDWFCSYPLEIAHFRNYLAAAHAGFPPPEPRADEICASMRGYEPMNALRGRNYGSPHLARLLNFIAQHLQSDKNSRFDHPYALANQLYLAHLECEGSARIENAEERTEAVNWAKIQAEARAEEEAEARLKTHQSGVDSGLATPPPDL